jgi:hypothetical protein
VDRIIIYIDLEAIVTNMSHFSSVELEIICFNLELGSDKKKLPIINTLHIFLQLLPLSTANFPFNNIQRDSSFTHNKFGSDDLC